MIVYNPLSSCYNSIYLDFPQEALSEMYSLYNYSKLYFQASAEGEESKRAAYESYISSYVTHHSDLTPCVQCLFERALASNCLDQTLWINYTEYMVSYVLLIENKMESFRK